MITIETQTKSRDQLLKTIRKTHQKLIDSDLSFWKKAMSNLFEQFSQLKSIAWGQGFFYNDEYNAFHTTKYKINDLLLHYEKYEYDPEYWDWNWRRESTQLDTQKIFLVHPSNDEKLYENWLRMRYQDKEGEQAFVMKMQIKYEPLQMVAIELIKFLNEIYAHFGQRHFADTFGRRAQVIFTPQGLFIEDYEDSDAAYQGRLDDIVG